MKENQYVKLIILRLWEQTPVPLFVFEELMSVVAVRERFELPDPFGSSVFKTDGLSHSPTLPFTDALHSESAHIHILLAFAIYSSTLKASDVDVSPNNLFMCSVASLSE